MYSISELAAKLGITRTTLLYYEKLGLLKGQRRDNGYRLYNERDYQRLHIIKQLQSAGLTLKECQNCLENKVDPTTLRKRLNQLNDDINTKLKARSLLLGLIGEESQRDFHNALNQGSSKEYVNWLHQQGFDEKQALRIRWLSKDMNEHDQYMQDFMHIFSMIERWGPGSDEATQLALSHIPVDAHQRLLEIGCGKGTSTILIAQGTGASITAVDNEILAIDALKQKVKRLNLKERIAPVCASMSELPFENNAFDVIWAEGCVYIIGMADALRQWKPFLKPGGYLMVSDLVWLSDQPDNESKEYWSSEYPDISNINTRLNMFEANGYEVINHFSLDTNGWRNYWQPLEERLLALKSIGEESQALQDIEREIKLYKKHAGKSFTYQYFILKKP